MRLFLKKLLFLAIPMVLLLVALESAIRVLPNSYKLKSYALNRDAEFIETLALGSSHTFYAINPKFFKSKTLNVANVSQSPDIDLAILHTYEERLSSLKTIVIRLSYDTLFEQLKNSSEDWRLKDYKLYTNIELDYDLRHNSEVYTLGVKQSLRLLKDNYLDNELLLNCDSLDWGNDIKNKPILNLQDVGKIVAERHTAKSWYLLNRNIKTFEETIDWCDNRDVKVVLVTFPAYKSYIDHLDSEQLAKMVSVGKYLAYKFSNCRYYNFMDRKDFIEEDFYDGDHLNEKGSKKISLIIDELIEN